MIYSSILCTLRPVSCLFGCHSMSSQPGKRIIFIYTGEIDNREVSAAAYSMCGYTYKAPHCRYDTVVPLDSHCWNSTSCIKISHQGELIRSQAEVISMLKWVARGPLAAAAAAAACIVYKFTWVSRITQPLN